MNTDELRRLVLEELADIAPDTDPAALDPAEDVRDALDLDPADERNLAIRLGDRLGIDIPEEDRGRLHTLADATAYLANRLVSPAR